jgi:hypothetical protein
VSVSVTHRQAQHDNVFLINFDEVDECLTALTKFTFRYGVNPLVQLIKTNHETVLLRFSFNDSSAGSLRAGKK